MFLFLYEVTSNDGISANVVPDGFVNLHASSRDDRGAIGSMAVTRDLFDLMLSGDRDGLRTAIPPIQRSKLANVYKIKLPAV